MISCYKGTFYKWGVPFFLLIGITCRPHTRNGSNAWHKSLSKQKTMETITLNVGNSTTLKFKSLATAGYVWDYELDKPGIVYVTPEGAAQTSNIPTGQSLDEVFDIEASAPGTVHLTFRQRRSWQKDSPLTVKEYTVEVK